LLLTISPLENLIPQFCITDRPVWTKAK